MKETPEYKRLVDENFEKVARLIDKGKNKQLKKVKKTTIKSLMQDIEDYITEKQQTTKQKERNLDIEKKY